MENTLHALQRGSKVLRTIEANFTMWQFYKQKKKFSNTELDISSNIWKISFCFVTTSLCWIWFVFADSIVVLFQKPWLNSWHTDQFTFICSCECDKQGDIWERNTSILIIMDNVTILSSFRIVFLWYFIKPISVN